VSKIFRKTLLAVILVFGVTANGSALLSAWLLNRHLTEAVESRGRGIATVVAAAESGALAEGKPVSLQIFLEAFARLDGVGYVAVFDRQGHVLAHALSEGASASVPLTATDDLAGAATAVREVRLADGTHYIQVAEPLPAGQDGWVVVGMETAVIAASMRGAVLGQEGLMLCMLLVAVAVFYVLAKTVTRPLVELAHYAVKIRDHDFSAVPPATGNDEVGVLARAMRSMAGELSLLVSDLTRAVADTTRELKDTLAHTRAIIDNLADGLLVVDPAGRVALYNPALLAMFGLKDDTVLTGRAASEVFPEELAGLTACGREDKALSAAEVRLQNGGTGKALATTVLLAEGAGLRASTVILVRDITREKEVDRMKTEFISTVSHELRTPLTSVLGFAKIIRRKFQDDIVPVLPGSDGRIGRCAGQIRDNLDIILAEGQRLTELVDDVLDIAKMESGRYEWDMAPLSLAEVAGHAVRAVSGLVARKGLALEVRVPPDLPGLLGDRDRLVQVFVNLLGNAVKFTDAGGIVLEARQAEDQIRVTVRDTGTGIAEADLERIFEKFKQAGNTLTEKPKGTGLGLPICRQIVEHHGGRIWAESRPGEGSAFIFTLPLCPGQGVTVAPSCPLPVDACQEPVEDLGRRRILVVDDDASVRRFLEMVLTDAGYAVLQAGNGVEALRLAAAWRPDCITMDLRMPGMDGVSTIRALRAEAETRHIPVIVVSVLSARERRETGADAAVVKPVDQEALLATVRGVLEGHDTQVRPCLVYSPEGSRALGSRFVMCPGAAMECSDEAELWRAVEGGFSGTVLVPASRGHDLDLARLAGMPDIHVIIVPD